MWFFPLFHQAWGAGSVCMRACPPLSSSLAPSCWPAAVHACAALPQVGCGWCERGVRGGGACAARPSSHPAPQTLPPFCARSFLPSERPRAMPTPFPCPPAAPPVCVCFYPQARRPRGPSPLRPPASPPHPPPPPPSFCQPGASCRRRSHPLLTPPPTPPLLCPPEGRWGVAAGGCKRVRRVWRCPPCPPPGAGVGAVVCVRRDPRGDRATNHHQKKTKKRQP